MSGSRSGAGIFYNAVAVVSAWGWSVTPTTLRLLMDWVKYAAPYRWPDNCCLTLLADVCAAVGAIVPPEFAEYGRAHSEIEAIRAVNNRFGSLANGYAHALVSTGWTSLPAGAVSLLPFDILFGKFHFPNAKPVDGQPAVLNEHYRIVGFTEHGLAPVSLAESATHHFRFTEAA